MGRRTRLMVFCYLNLEFKKQDKFPYLFLDIFDLNFVELNCSASTPPSLAPKPKFAALPVAPPIPAKPKKIRKKLKNNSKSIEGSPKIPLKNVSYFSHVALLGAVHK